MRTGKYWLIYSVNHIGVLVTRLDNTDNPTAMSVILPRDYQNWKRDIEVPTAKVKEIQKWDQNLVEMIDAHVVLV